MFSVAICDDDIGFCKELEHMVINCIGKLRISYKITVYHSTRNLYYDLLEGIIFDILFLDIEFPLESMNGIDIGNNLREVLKNEYSQIVYVSIMPTYAMQLFETHPLNFFVKPVNTEKLEKVLDKAVKLKGEYRKIFTYQFRSQNYQIELGKILYFQSEGRKIKLFCRDGEEYYYNGKISDVKNKLCNDKFFSPHKSYVVNYYAVKQWGKKEIVLSDGTFVPVSRKNAKEIQKMLLEYEFN